MLVRIFFIVLALLMLAAPVGDVVVEAAEVASAIAVDEEPVTTPTVALFEEAPPRIVQFARAAETAPPAPILAGVFRPPRPAFD